MKNDIASSVAKATPAVGANFWLWLMSKDINWWVASATLLYVLLQVFVLVRDKVIERRRGKDSDDDLLGI